MSRSCAIRTVHARRVWDSQGRPTVEAEVHLHDGAVGRAIVPADGVTGARAGERQHGMQVQQAVAQVQGEIAHAVQGMAADDQVRLDTRLMALGAGAVAGPGNGATLAVSMAAAHAAAASHRLPLYRYLRGRDEQQLLPLPQVQIFGGGAAAGRRVDIQDFMVVCPGATSFAQALDWTAEVYRHAGLGLRARGTLAGVADEGGWWPAFDSNEEALEALVRAIESAGFVPGGQVAIALDIAASAFGRAGRYHLGLDRRELDSDGLIELLLRWCGRFPIASIEDPLADDDRAGFARFTAAAGQQLQVVADELVRSDAGLLRQASAAGAANAVLLTPSLSRTLTETWQCWQTAREVGYAGIVSARASETEDTTIVHLAIGWQVGQLKVGSFARSERMAKWNEALRIEEALGAQARYAGAAVFGRSAASGSPG